MIFDVPSFIDTFPLFACESAISDVHRSAFNDQGTIEKKKKHIAARKKSIEARSLIIPQVKK